jgi:hypothetical protein
MAPRPDNRTDYQAASETMSWAQIAARLGMASIFRCASLGI